MEVKKPFIDQYNDNESSQYKEFVSNFTVDMKIYYSTRIVSFKSVNVTKLSRPTRRSRSVIQDLLNEIEYRALNYVRIENTGVRVEHNVVLEVTNSAEAETELDTLLEQVKTAVEEVKNCSDHTAGCPGFEVTSTEPPVKEDLDLTALCRNSVLDPEHAKHYSAVNISGVMKCVNQCSREHPDPFTCDHDGTCAVLAAEGPQCYCLHTDSTWFMGERCSHPVNKIGFYVGMSVSGVVLVVLVGVLSAFLALSRQRDRRNRDIKEQIVNEWLDDDFEWPPSRRSARPYTEANNESFEGEEMTLCRQSVGVLPSNTQQAVHYPQSSSIPRPSLNPYMFGNKPVRALRPQIKTSEV